MKKSFILFFTTILLSALTITAAAQGPDHWLCLICGAQNSAHLCGECGHQEGSWICPECHTINSGEICTECGKAKSDVFFTDENGNLFFIRRGGIQNGEGILVRPEGIFFEGKWENGLPTGIGIMRWPYGGTYEGEFENGERNGHGKCIGTTARFTSAAG